MKRGLKGRKVFYLGIDPAQNHIGFVLIDKDVKVLYSATQNIMNIHESFERAKEIIGDGFVVACIEKFSNMPIFKVCGSSAKQLQNEVKKYFRGRNIVFRFYPQEWRKKQFGKEGCNRKGTEHLKFVSIQYARAMGFEPDDDNQSDGFHLAIVAKNEFNATYLGKV
jgi:hypothetical protein